MNTFGAIVLGFGLLAIIGSSQAYDFIDYQATDDSDGGTISTNVNDVCANVEAFPTKAIVDVVGCFVLYDEKDCSGGSDEVDSVNTESDYAISKVASYKTVTCPEK